MELVRAVVVDPSKRKFSREKAQNNATQNQDNNTSDIGESQFSLNLEDSVLESSSLPQDVWKNLFYRNDYMEILRNKVTVTLSALISQYVIIYHQTFSCLISYKLIEK